MLQTHLTIGLHLCYLHLSLSEQTLLSLSLGLGLRRVRASLY